MHVRIYIYIFEMPSGPFPRADLQSRLRRTTAKAFAEDVFIDR